MTPSWNASTSWLAAAALATCLLCATVAASDVHLPTLFSESGVSRPEGKGGTFRGGGSDDGAVQLHDADAPHDTHEVHGDEDESAEGGSANSGGGGGGGDEFRCNTEKNADYGGPIAFVWVWG